MAKFFIIFFSFFAIINFTFATTLEYQKIADFRNDNVVIKLYETDKSLYVVCNLTNWTCDNNNATTTNPYANVLNITNANYYFSESNNYFITSIKIKVNKRIKKLYLLYRTNVNAPIFEKLLNYNEPFTNVLFANNDSTIIFINNNHLVIFDTRQNKVLKKVNNIPSGSFLKISPKLNYVASYNAALMSTGKRKFSVVNINSGQIYNIEEKINFWDLLTENSEIFDFNEDETKLFLLDDIDGFQTLYSLDLNNFSEKKRLFNENFIVANFIVANNIIYFIANKNNPLEWSLFSYNIETDTTKNLIDNVSYYPSLFRYKNFIFFTKLSEKPSEVFTLNLLNQSIKKLPLESKNSPIALIGEIKKFSNTFGVLNKPNSFLSQNEYPLIIWLHGGPHRQTSLSFHPYISYGIYDNILETLRKNGFIILKLDYSGSFGYGRNFAEKIKNNVGSLDVNDVLTATNELKNEMKISNIYLMGNSYGGYLSLRALAESTSTFTGAISISGVTDWWSLIKNNPKSIFNIHFNGAPNTSNKDLYDKASIFLRLENIKDKQIMLAYGEQDKTIPKSQTLMLYEKLKDYPNKQLISFEKDGHIPLRYKNLQYLCEEILKFIGVSEIKNCFE